MIRYLLIGVPALAAVVLWAQGYGGAVMAIATVAGLAVVFTLRWLYRAHMVLSWPQAYQEWKDCPECEGSGALVLDGGRYRKVTVRGIIDPKARVFRTPSANADDCWLCGGTSRVPVTYNSALHDLKPPPPPRRPQ
jgi:hypothetical protein